ncbi:ATP-binding cassette domain-containing protein [Micromonospora tarensis]|uniref:ABC transporter ATP-binding protein n=1 Tax=Micromonospora tarensis TaxID=2806100 RepID=A0ABS1YA58_9ACTN|nr:ABC transporter ATP-binding protein [Micromonospora tarensis]MBM0274279.1 ABC transporter ATP-binding protein [Micromonospora tarensis]
MFLILALAGVNAASIATTGASLRWLVDSARVGLLPTIALAACLGALAYAVVATAQRVQHNLQVDLTERVDIVISQEILTTVASIPTVSHLERPQDVDRISQLERNTESLAGVCWTALGTFTSFVSLALSVLLLYLVHPALTLLAVLAAPPLLLSRYATRRISQAKDRTAATVRKEKNLHELCTTAGPAKELRISGAVPVVSRAADASWEATTRVLVAARVRAAAAHAAGWVCFGAGHVGALALVVHLLGQGRGTVGGLILVASLASYLRVQLTATVSGVGQVAEANHALEQYLWLADHAERQRRSGGAAPPAQLTNGLRLRGVSFRYPGAGTELLADIDLDLKAGSVVALVGMNGAGKTTLVKLLMGMYRPSRGAILVDDTPLADIDPVAWSSELTGAFQDYAKLETRVRETVGVGDLRRVSDRTAVQTAVAEAGATALVEQLPDGLETQLGTLFNGTQLSHGQWQKLALGRALMRRTPLLAVLDEPTAALDPQAENDLYEQFVGAARVARQVRGGIVLLVSHRFSTVSMADHIVVLSGGTVIEQGSHRELMALDGEYAELYEAHARGYV